MIPTLTIALIIALAVLLAAVAVVALISAHSEISALQTRVFRLEQRLENAHVDILTHQGLDYAHTHAAVISFPIRHERSAK